MAQWEAFGTSRTTAGVTTEFHLYPGFHGSVGLTDTAISQTMLSVVMDGLRRGLRAHSVR